MLYPTRQPVTQANIDAWLAERIAARGKVLPTARTNIRVTKLSASAAAAVVERMAHDMRMFGEGMTRNDLRLAGYSDDVLDLCAEKASARASQTASFN